MRVRAVLRILRCVAFAALAMASASQSKAVPQAAPAHDEAQPKNDVAADATSEKLPTIVGIDSASGIDLSMAHWVADAHEISDLYEQVPSQPGKWRQRANVFAMPMI